MKEKDINRLEKHQMDMSNIIDKFLPICNSFLSEFVNPP